LQPYAEQVRADTGVDFVVAMGLDRARFSHPDPAQIGKPFIGDLGGAPEGRVFTQEYTGTLGPSSRAVVPVYEGDRVVALVSVGITLEHIDQQLRGDLRSILLAAAGALAVGALGAWLISRRLRHQTHGMGAGEITRMYEYYSAVLHAVREGMLLVDENGAVQLVNDEARRLLALPEDVAGRPLDELGVPAGLLEAARSGTPEADQLYVLGEHVLLISTAPARWGGRGVGAVVTLRDRTELQEVTGQLDQVRGLTESLRSQTHEAANRLHTVVSLIEMGRSDEAVEFATEELRVAQSLADHVVGAVREPVLAALLLGKSAEADERGVELVVEGGGDLAELPVPARDLVTVVGNLVDNALDAVLEERAEGEQTRRQKIEVRVVADATGIDVVVEDSGPGVRPQEEDRVLQRGWSTKASDGRGLGLALVGQVAGRHGGRIDVGTSPLGGARFHVHLAASREVDP
jgi:sensor histidine kinase regulating citrate/malate metabolism